MTVIGFALLMALACAYSIAAIAWIVAVANLFRTIANRRPGISTWHRRLAYFPPNIVFFPDLLTERGRVFRRRFTLSALAFFAAIGLGLVVAGLATSLQ